MAAPDDRQILLRRFEGVNLLVDSAYLGPAYLRRAQNWIPGETFRLEKRPGATAYDGEALPAGITRIPAMIATRSTIGQRLLAVVGTVPTSSADFLFISYNEGDWSVGHQIGSTAGRRYGMEAIGGLIYVGNGVDPLVLVDVDANTIINLAAIGSWTGTEANATLTADSGGQILSGTYAYCWCIFDHTDEVWLERSTTRQITKTATGDEAIIFPAPIGFTTNGGAVSDRYRAHLFIAPVNYPVEFAHDHTPQGIDGVELTAPVTMRSITADGPTVPLRGVARTGNILRAHRGRLYVSGNPDDPTSVWATSILQPGREQAIYNAGVFFPHNARLPRFPEPVTGMGLAAVGERADTAIDGPLVITTLTRTYLFFGDILDDPSARIVLVSRRAGCINKDAMVETPYGLFYPGLESVYWVPPGGDVPVDVGWPISPVIKALTVGQRPFVTAIYHKGFYKLAIVPPGAAHAEEQWWLDLRRGVGSVPSWWGNHRGAAPSAWCTTPHHPTEPDRGYMALEGTKDIETIHQRRYRENGEDVIVSVLRTGELDNGQPFERKLFKRVRAIGFPNATTETAVRLKVDGRPYAASEGTGGPLDPLVFEAAGGAIWNVDEWNVAQWGSAPSYTEGESILPEDRARGRSVELQLTHEDPTGLAIREIEIWYHPSERKPRSTPDQPNS